MSSGGISQEMPRPYQSLVDFPGRLLRPAAR